MIVEQRITQANPELRSAVTGRAGELQPPTPPAANHDIPTTESAFAHDALAFFRARLPRLAGLELVQELESGFVSGNGVHGML